MKLTRASSYALHAVAYMAEQDSDKPVASHLIADARGIPERFLLKVLKPLVTADILESTKGPNGGYSLARAASTISVLEILEAVDGTIRGIAPRFTVKDDPDPEKPRKSPEQKAAIDKTNAPLNNKLDQICGQSAEAIKKHLDSVTITDLMAGGTLTKLRSLEPVAGAKPTLTSTVTAKPTIAKAPVAKPPLAKAPITKTAKRQPVKAKN